MRNLLRWITAGSIALGTSIAIAGPTPDGSLDHRIPIPVPKGAGTATPSIGLVYNSSSTNGYAGRSVTIDGLPAIRRINAEQPIRYAEDDAFAGPHGRLYKVGVDTYHGGAEDFAVYRASGKCGFGPCIWTMEDRQGNTWSFGATTDSRIEGVGKGESVRVWALSRFQDRNGNIYDVTYKEDAVNGDYYPLQIRWGAQKFRTVDFVWEPRPDSIAMFDQSARVAMDERLKRVEVFSGGATVRKMILGYNADGRLTSLGEQGADGTSTLPPQTFTWATNAPFRFGPASIVGTAGASSTYPPRPGTPAPNDPKDDVLPGDFDGDGLQDVFNHLGSKLYVRHARSTVSGVPTWDVVADNQIASSWGKRELTRVGDFDGDGRDDVISLAPCSSICSIGGIGYTPAWIYRGRTGALASQMTQVMYTSASSWNTSGFFWAADFDGDGRADLASRDGNNVKVALSTGADFAPPVTWTGSTTWGVVEATYIVDFDGDGRSDILTTQGRDIYVMRSTGTGFTQIHAYWSANPVSLASNRMWVGDFNGDGKTDITARQSLGGGLATMFVCLSTGTGTSCSETTTPDVFGAKNFAADFDGDGKTDLLSVNIPAGHVDAQGITATSMLRKLAPTGYTYDYFGFVQLVNAGSGGVEGASLVTVGDADGNGMPDLIQVNPSSQGYIQITRFDTRLQRLESISNGLGGVVSFGWTPQRLHGSAIRYEPVCGGSATLPDCGIPDRSGRPLLTSMTSTTEAVTKQLSYTYSTSRLVAGPPGRAAFLGFRTVIAKDAATNIYTSDLYRQAKPLTGSVEEHRVYLVENDGVEQGQSRPILEIYNDAPAQFVCTEAGCTASSSANPDAPRQIRGARSRSRHYEIGQLLYEITTTPTYDSFGNTTAVTAWGTDPLNNQLYQERQMTIFLNQTTVGNRAVGLPYEGKLCVDGPCTEPVTWTRTYFDNLPLGSIGTTHRMTKVETWTGGSTFAAQAYVHDASGNVISERSPDGQTRTFAYDAIFRSERISENDPIAGITTIIPDDRWNTPTNIKHQTGREQQFVLDPFGRPSTQITLDTPGALPGTPYHKRVFAMPTGPGPANKTERCDYFDADGDPSTPFDAQLCTRTWADGFGRKLTSETDAAGGPARVVIGYDATGNEASVTEPHHVGDPVFATVTEYDVLGRPTKVTHTDGNTETVRYNTVPLAPGAVTVDEGTDARGLVSQRHRDVKGRVVRLVEGIATTCVLLPDVPPCCIAVQGDHKAGDPLSVDPYPKDPPKLKCTTSSGVITDYVYDVYGRLVAIEGPDDITTIIAYDAAGRRESVTHPSSGTTSWTYYTTPDIASFGKVRTETRPAPNAATGTVVSTYHYDAKGRLADRLDSDGTQVVMKYDETDVTNGRGRLTTARSTAGGFTVIERFGYDLDGNVTRARRRIETAAGALLAEGTTDTRFDALGRMVASVYPDGTTLQQTFFASGQLEKLAIDGVSQARFGGWDPRGKLGVLEFTNGVTTHYDYTPETGRLKTLTTTSNAQTLLANQYAFDGDGNLEHLDDTVQTALGTNYRYDALNRLRRAERADGKLFDYLYTDGGRMAVFSELDTTGHVVVRTRGIDAATGRLADDGTQPLVYGAGGALLERGDRHYAYDDQARLSSIAVAGSVVQQNVYSHTHQRVLRIERPSAGVEIRTYVLGDHYEVTERLEGGVVTERRGTRLIQGPDGGRIVSLTADLSTSGPVNPIAALSHYAPVSTRPIQIALLGFSVVALGFLWFSGMRRPRRRRRWLAHVAPALALAVFNVAACGGPAAIATTNLELTGGSQTEAKGVLYYTGNHIGSTSLVTDSQGNEVVRLAYAPFGGTDPVNSGVLVGGGVDPSPATPPVGFTGARLDRDVSLYEMGRRFYDPSLGIFLTSDTLLPNPLSTQDQSIYSYAGNNPAVYSDPSGHIAWLLPAIVGFVLGAIYGGTNGKPWSGDAWSNFNVGDALFYGALGALAGGAGYFLPSVSVGGVGVPTVAMTRAGIISTALAWHSGERDVVDLVRTFAASAIQAGVYETGLWNDPKGFFYADAASRTLVTWLQRGWKGTEIGLGLFSVNASNGDVAFSWGRMIHLGVTHANASPGDKEFYEGWSWKRMNAYGNLGVLTMSVDEYVVGEIHYNTERAAQRTHSSRWTRLTAEIGASAVYGLVRLGLSQAVVRGIPPAYRTAGNAGLGLYYLGAGAGFVGLLAAY